MASRRHFALPTDIAFAQAVPGRRGGFEQRQKRLGERLTALRELSGSDILTPALGPDL